MIHGVSVSPADTVQETAAVLYGGAKYILAPYATFARDTLGTTSAALIYPEGAGQDEGAQGPGFGVRGGRHPDRGRVLPGRHG